MARVKEIRGGEKGREATKHSRYFVIKKVAKKFFNPKKFVCKKIKFSEGIKSFICLYYGSLEIDLGPPTRTNIVTKLNDKASLFY